MRRRTFLALAAGGPAAATAAVAGWISLRRSDVPANRLVGTQLAPVGTLPADRTRTWIGPTYWANRLGDWRLAKGRIEARVSGVGGRTVAVLAREVDGGATSGSVSVRTGLLGKGPGFSGFVVGAGGGDLDWRAAALVMGPSGEGGGLLAVYDGDGKVSFRDHTDETNVWDYAELPAAERRGPATARRLGEDVTLRLDVQARGDGTCDLYLTASTTAGGKVLSSATLTGVPDERLAGGLSLISAVPGGGKGGRHWFADLRAGGERFPERDRRAGPVLGILYSLADGVLKLSAQFLPVGDDDPQEAVLEASTGAGSWRPVARAPIGPGHTAQFRVERWPADEDTAIRVSYAAGTPQEAHYAGVVRREPADAAALTIGMVNCTSHTFRPLDGRTSGAPTLPGEKPRGLYTRRNLYFPYDRLVAGLDRHEPDLLVALGDQFYEDRPTRTDREGRPVYDMLSRYYLWLWSFGELTRRTPTICLVDDHDVYQGNLWGWAGRPAPNGDRSLGGYAMPAEWVNLVQRVQCGHNPDPFGPKPVEQGISVYYCAFRYGGVSFAVLEDRKFKNTNQPGVDEKGRPLPEERDLLGARQERFLREWGKMHPGSPKVCLTQTAFASLQTTPDGKAIADSDSNGTPVSGRQTALRILKKAGAVVLSGDQHLATLVRHGIESFTDGPVQFTAPAAGTMWQRWFQPFLPLANAHGPHTGDYVDGFGNQVHVLAVANPKVAFADVVAVQGNDQRVGDPDLKADGYGILRVDKESSSFRFECWPAAVDPQAPEGEQYAGWPYELPFSQV